MSTKNVSILLTIAAFSPLVFAFCPAFPIIEGELCEGDTISFMSVSIVYHVKLEMQNFRNLLFIVAKFAQFFSVKRKLRLACF